MFVSRDSWVWPLKINLLKCAIKLFFLHPLQSRSYLHIEMNNLWLIKPLGWNVTGRRSGRVKTVCFFLLAHISDTICRVFKELMMMEPDRGKVLGMPGVYVMDSVSASLSIRLVLFCLSACICNPSPKLLPLTIFFLPCLYLKGGWRHPGRSRWHWANWQRKEQKKYGLFLCIRPSTTHPCLWPQTDTWRSHAECECHSSTRGKDRRAAPHTYFS